MQGEKVENLQSRIEDLESKLEMVSGVRWLVLCSCVGLIWYIRAAEFIILSPSYQLRTTGHQLLMVNIPLVSISTPKISRVHVPLHKIKSLNIILLHAMMYSQILALDSAVNVTTSIARNQRITRNFISSFND